jgi:BirA family biotin operon repressor/biotin-[acetyl-CoA-carboxylase] ligase
VNLLASVLLRPGCEADDLHLCSGAVALAAADACAEAAGVEPVLKWPNDLLIGGSKLAGVLAEADFDGSRLRGVVVGIGVNVGWPGPAEAGGTCLDDAGGRAQSVDKEIVLDLLLAGLARRRPLLDDEAGRRTLAAEVRRRCATLGQRVRVTLPNEELTGVASAIDDGGHLVVETKSGRRLVSAGDVVHLRPE